MKSSFELFDKIATNSPQKSESNKPLLRCIPLQARPDLPSNSSAHPGGIAAFILSGTPPARITTLCPLCKSYAADPAVPLTSNKEPLIPVYPVGKIKF